MSAGRHSIWIISPAADLGLLILSPLAILPLLTWLASSQVAPETIGLAVFAFASLGHHLPGLMRAYGDRELFAQYRWRFLLAPPLAFGVCWLSLVALKLHGLELLLLVWATWHILMQTYGFMRIYDMKQGFRQRWHANWDFYACVTVFAAGFLWSDVRMYGFADTLSLAGVPLFGPELFTAARYLVGAAAVVVLTGYLVVALFARRRAAEANWLKIMLLACTALLYWWSGNLSVHLLVGVAMFDIFHAIQYNAIVWYYNRRRAEKGGAQAGWLPYLFHGRWWSLPLYLAAIAGFGALGLWGRTTEPGLLSQMAMALFVASAMLHFYYDGFIWKVSQPQTSENLNIDSTAASPVIGRPSRHAVGWMAVATLLLSLGAWELHAKTDAAEAQRLLALAELTPEVPELQMRLSHAAISRGDYRTAYRAAEAAVRQRPRSFEALTAVGDAAYALGDWDRAHEAYLAARAIRPADPTFEVQLADIYFRQGNAVMEQQQYEAARRLLTQCVELQPHHAQAHYQLGNAYLYTEQPNLAVDQYRLCIADEPQFSEAYNNLGAALYQANELPEAADAYRHSIELEPNFAPAHYNLALVLISQGATIDARRSVQQAAALGQRPSAEVLRAVGF